MILVNGSKGIGTGFSTDIMSYNPLDIIDYLKMKLDSKSIESNGFKEFIPYYEGFLGTIEKIQESKFLIKGKYEKLGPDKICVSELPIGYWTENFKEHLENLLEPGQDKNGKKIVSTLKDYDDMSKDTNVDFIIIFQKGKLEELEGNIGDYGCNGVEKLLKLYTTNTSTNMHLFDANDKLKKYSKIPEIIDDYFETRIQMYQTRKEYMIDSLEKELVLLSNKAKYIKENLDGTIDLRKKKKEEVNVLLEKKGYAIIDDNDKDYKYLTKMPMDSVTEENVEKLFKEQICKKEELEIVKQTTIHTMWIRELDHLKNVYQEYREERQRFLLGEDDKPKKKKIVKNKNMKNVVLLEEE
jgi:DNA topoisomerase-2